MKGTDVQLVDLLQPDYQSFMLRIWRSSVDEPWRGSLQSTATNEVCHFGSLIELFACLEQQLAKLNGARPNVQITVEPDPIVPSAAALLEPDTLVLPPVSDLLPADIELPLAVVAPPNA